MKSARLRRQCCKWVLNFNLSQISLLSLPQKSHYEVNANIFDLFPVYAAVSAHTWILKKKPLMYYEPLTSTNGFNSLRKKVLAEKNVLGEIMESTYAAHHATMLPRLIPRVCVIESGDPSDLSRTPTCTQLRHLCSGAKKVSSL